MYTTCTIRLSAALGLRALVHIARVVVYVALAAWAPTFTGFLLRLARTFRSPARGSGPQVSPWLAMRRP